jgi:hypothetical protein
MGVKSVLAKLAEKEALKGNQEFAYNLVVLAETGKCKGCGTKCEGSMCSKCSKVTSCSLAGCDVKKAYGEMVKKGEKCYCCEGCAGKDKKVKSALAELIKKYAQDYTDSFDSMSEQNPYADDPMKAQIWQEGYDAGSGKSDLGSDHGMPLGDDSNSDGF